MTRKILLVLFFSLGFAFLGACTKLPISVSLPDKEKEYLESKNGQKLVVPKHLVAENIKHDYVVPEVKGQPGAATIIPPESQITMAGSRGEVVEGVPPLAEPIQASQVSLQDKQAYPALVIQRPFLQAQAAVIRGMYGNRMKLVSISADKKQFFVVPTYSSTGRFIKNAMPFCIQFEVLTKNETKVIILDHEAKPVPHNIAARILENLRSGMQSTLRFSMAEWFR